MTRLGLTMLTILLVCSCASAERQDEIARKAKLVQTYTELGGVYLQRGQLGVANEELTKALELDSTSAVANNVMAVLQWKLKNYRAAEDHFRTALDSDPTNSSVHHNYGAFLCDRGRVDDGARELEKAANDPLYSLGADVNVNAGICMLKKGAASLAEQYFREALRINAKQPRALFELAKISFENGELLAARGFLQRYFQFGMESAESLYVAVRIERSLKNRESEASYAVRLHEKFPDSPEAVQLAKEYKGTRTKN